MSIYWLWIDGLSFKSPQPQSAPFACSISLSSHGLNFLTSRQTVIISETGCKTKAYCACTVPVFISATCKAVLCHWYDNGKPECITNAFEILFLKSFVVLNFNYYARRSLWQPKGVERKVALHLGGGLVWLSYCSGPLTHSQMWKSCLKASHCLAALCMCPSDGDDSPPSFPGLLFFPQWQPAVSFRCHHLTVNAGATSWLSLRASVHMCVNKCRMALLGSVPLRICRSSAMADFICKS